MLVSKPDWDIICGLWNRNAREEMRRNQVGWNFIFFHLDFGIENSVDGGLGVY